jgi:AcrR family transcriptional regulator
MKQDAHITQQAHQQFRRYGIRSVTMDVLCTELGISKKTLYATFRDKDELVHSVVDQDLEENQRILLQIAGREQDALSEFMEIYRWTLHLREEFSPAFYFDLKRYYSKAFLHWSFSRRNALLDAIRANLTKGISQGVYRSDIDAEVIGQLHVARIEMLESGDLISSRLSHSGVFLDQLLRYHLHGICNPRGLEKLQAHFNNEQTSTA